MLTKFSTLAIASGIVLAAGAASAATVTQDFGPYEDIDQAGGSSFTFSVTETGTIEDLDVSLTFDNVFNGEAFLSDLEITLSHDGVSVLLSDNGLGVDDTPIDVYFDDDGSGIAPDNALSAFDGMDIFGDWTISFVDTYVFPNEGDSVSGSLIFQVAAVPLPASALLLLTGALGLGALRRRKS